MKFAMQVCSGYFVDRPLSEDSFYFYLTLFELIHTQCKDINHQTNC